MDEQNGLQELPKGWTQTTVGEIADLIHYGYTESATSENTGTKFLRITDIQNNNVDWDSVPFCKIGEIEREKYLLNERDLLFARTGATVGKSFLIRGLIPKSIFASYLIRIILNKEVNERFIYNFFQSSNYWLQILENQVGVGQPNVNGTILSTLKLPLPPLNEQARIVAKIEELFTKLDAGIDALRAIQKQIKRYRQAVLRDAVTGELTKAWREENQAELEPGDALLKRILTERRDRWEQEQLKKFAESGKTPKNADWKKKYKEPATPSTENLPELPNEWTWASLDQCSYRITDGTHQPPTFTSEGIPFVFVKHIVKGKILFENTKFISAETYEMLNKRCPVEKGDILYSAVGSFGVAVPVNAEKNFSFQRHIAHIKPSDFVNEHYIVHFLNSQIGYRQADNVAKGVAQRTVTLGDLTNFHFSLPPLAEQQKIVEEVERLLSVADAVEATVKQSLKQAERLRQSILKRAFEGKLVPQDETDERAEILLERIEQEREEKAAEIKLQKVKANKTKAKTKNAVQK